MKINKQWRLAEMKRLCSGLAAAKAARSGISGSRQWRLVA
jgi:hypothetical protein